MNDNLLNDNEHPGKKLGYSNALFNDLSKLTVVSIDHNIVATVTEMLTIKRGHASIDKIGHDSLEGVAMDGDIIRVLKFTGNVVTTTESDQLPAPKSSASDMMSKRLPTMLIGNFKVRAVIAMM